jgi:antitoxin ParD1/3/4
MEKASITLTEAHHQLLHSVVEAGEYATVSEAIRDALRDWERKRVARDLELDILRQQLAEGMADYKAGRVVPWDPEATKARILDSL